MMTRQFKTASLLKFLSHYILGKRKFDSLVHLILKCLLGYMMTDDNEEVKFSAVPPDDDCPENCSFGDIP